MKRLGFYSLLLLFFCSCNKRIIVQKEIVTDSIFVTKIERQRTDTQTFIYLHDTIVINNEIEKIKIIRVSENEVKIENVKKPRKEVLRQNKKSVITEKEKKQKQIIEDFREKNKNLSYLNSFLKLLFLFLFIILIYSVIKLFK